MAGGSWSARGRGEPECPWPGGSQSARGRGEPECPWPEGAGVLVKGGGGVGGKLECLGELNKTWMLGGSGVGGYSLHPKSSGSD